MAKELYIYSGIYSYMVETANKQLSQVKDSEQLTVRFNSPGGETNAGFAFLSKLSERKAKTNAIVDGQAKSMAAYMLPFFDSVTANDTSEIMFHKAAYPKWYEPTEAELESLKKTNARFEEKMRAKVEGKPGAEAFLSKLFAEDKRNNVELTALQAKELGIVSDVRTLEVKAYDNMQIVALAEDGELIKNELPKTPTIGAQNNLKTKNMDLAKLKAEHPAVYQQAFAEGKAEGVNKERDRVEAWAVYNEVNPEKVKEGIVGGKELNAKAMAEFNLELGKKAKLEAMKEENPDAPTPPAEAKTEDQLKEEENKKAMDELFKKGE